MLFPHKGAAGVTGTTQCFEWDSWPVSGADKREIDARILEQKSVLETAEHERNEFRNKLQQAESEGTKKTLLLSVPSDISTLGIWTGTENVRFWPRHL